MLSLHTCHTKKVLLQCCLVSAVILASATASRIGSSFAYESDTQQMLRHGPFQRHRGSGRLRLRSGLVGVICPFVPHISSAAATSSQGPAAQSQYPHLHRELPPFRVLHGTLRA
ncbi:hypothetical protein BD310DRAFT_413265 [Dichomitus squalens]|uniref:Secreted protein n=1 Tax=Dichomitus squalens TaxID=114155 RepID=A0A4Q9PXD8_9APHY|nr:hypothetical protein BD310DRAFT_413265 [Dichomitus squalens]